MLRYWFWAPAQYGSSWVWKNNETFYKPFQSHLIFKHPTCNIYWDLLAWNWLENTCAFLVSLSHCKGQYKALHTAFITKLMLLLRNLGQTILYSWHGCKEQRLLLWFSNNSTKTNNPRLRTKMCCHLNPQHNTQLDENYRKNPNFTMSFRNMSSKTFNNNNSNSKLTISIVNRQVKPASCIQPCC